MMPPCPGKRLETGNHDLLIAKGGGETKICPPWCIFFSFPSFLHSFLSFLLSLFLSAAVAFHMSGKTCLRNKKLITAPSCHHLVFFSKYVGESVLIEYLIRCVCILFCLHLPAYAHEGNLCSHPAPANLPARYEWKIVHPIVPKHSNNSLCASKGLLHF